ncbi:hypothetical protein WA158_003980 [Blastocystis sp. Blastoise]
MEEIYNLNSNEALCNIFTVSWRIQIDTCVTKDEIHYALQCTHSEHPFLRCKIIKTNPKNPFEMHLVDDKSNEPEFIYEDVIFGELDIKDEYESFVRKVSNDDTRIKSCCYKILVDMKKNCTVIIGCFNHACCDALSSMQVAHSLLSYLSNPPKEFPLSRKWVSVQGEIEIPQDWHNTYYESVTGDIYSPPTKLHEGDKIENTRFQSDIAFLPSNELQTVINICHQHGCTFQSLLWLSSAINQMKLFHSEFPKIFRFQTPATTINRVHFKHPIQHEDLVCGAAAIYVREELNSNDLFWTICKEIKDKLYKELENRTQIYDFFKIMDTFDFTKLPGQSLTACTLGVTCIQQEYKGIHPFHLDSIHFLAVSRVFPNMGGINIHSFTINDYGCILNCTYATPAFLQSEAIQYIEGVKNTILNVCKYQDLSLEECLKE